MWTGTKQWPSPVGFPLSLSRHHARIEARLSATDCRPTTVQKICAFPNLLLAWGKAAKGKRGGCAATDFEYGLADRLLQLQEELLTGNYRPGAYTHFYIHEPKRRRISAAPFRDRVVHVETGCSGTVISFETAFPSS